MRKADVHDVSLRFDKDIERLETMLNGTWGNGGPSRKLLIEASLMFAAVRWERFIHELFVAHINRDSRPLQKCLQNAVSQSVKEKRGAVVAASVQVALPKHLSLAKVEDVLDREGQNLTFKETSSLLTRASEWLPAAQAAKFAALSPADLACVDTLLAVRNFLAHRSSSSKDTMNAALRATHLNSYLKRQAHRIGDVGAHFEAAKGNDTKARVTVLLSALRNIAAKL